MQDTIKNDDLEHALEILCKHLPKGVMKEGDKSNAIAMMKSALQTAYPDGVPVDLFKDPVKQKNLLIGLASGPLMKNNPALKFNLGLLFNPELKPQEVKTLFKTFLTELNKLEPDPNKRRSEKEIDAEADALLNDIVKEKKEKQEEGESARLVDNKSAGDALEDLFENLYGITQSGSDVILSVDKGNSSAIIDNSPAIKRGRGSIHTGRGLAGDDTTDSYVDTMAKERLLDLGGLSPEILKDLKASGIIHTSPTMKPPGSI